MELGSPLRVRRGLELVVELGFHLGCNAPVVLRMKIDYNVILLAPPGQTHTVVTSRP
jgi:hypothetical protein